MSDLEPAGWSRKEIRRISHRVADQVADHLIGVPDGPVYGRPACRPGNWTDTTALLTALQLGRRSLLAGTLVDGSFVLRACIVNPLTSTRRRSSTTSERAMVPERTRSGMTAICRFVSHGR